MLLERATGLTEKIRRYQTLKDAAKEAEIVRTRAEQVRQAAALLAQAREALSRFTAADVMVDFVPANIDELSKKARKLRTIAAEAPVELANLPFNIAYEFTNKLSGLSAGANAAIRERWRRFISENSPGGSDEVLDALGKLPQLRAGVTQIRQCRQRIEVLAATSPVDPAQAVAQLRELVAEHRSAWTALTTDNLPGTVILFLRACAGEGAPVTSLTEEVRDWLDARNLLGSLRIRIG